MQDAEAAMTNEINHVNLVRRRGRKPKNVTCKHLTHLKLFSTNTPGLLKGKLESLKAEVTSMKAYVVTVQETHSTKKGKIQIPDFVTFEAIRKKKGGGTMVSVH